MVVRSGATERGAVHRCPQRSAGILWRNPRPRRTRELGREANQHPPELRLFDQGGRRLDEIRFHPSYHRIMDISQSAGYASLAWDGQPGGHATHAAMMYMAGQIEPGHCCPLTMTYAAIPALEANRRHRCNLAAQTDGPQL